MEVFRLPVKNQGVLKLMTRKFISALLAISLIFIKAVASYAGENKPKAIELEPVVVTSSRIPVKLSENSRGVSIITSEEIKSMPVNSLPELFNYTAGLDIR